MPVDYQPFETFRAAVQRLVAPEDLAEQLQPYFRDQVGNALCDIQTLVTCYRSFNARFYTKDQVSEFCAASIFDGPVGKITSIFAFKPGKDCRKFYYQRVSQAELDCWIEKQRCALCGVTVPPSSHIYDSPYCNYWIDGVYSCDEPYLLTDTEDDCKFRGLDDDDRIFAVGPDYKIYAAPRFPCGYTLLVQWQGINRKWEDNDLVPVDQQLREAVNNYVEHRVASKEKDVRTSEYYFEQYTINLRMLKQRCRDEEETGLKRDCSAGIEQLMAAHSPLYPTALYSPVQVTQPACPECPEPVECPECPECPPAEVPLVHSAVYVPSTGKIVGVRGGFYFKFNADTLEKEDESQFNFGPTLSDSYICYDVGRDKVWVTYSPDFFVPSSSNSPTNDKYIYKLNAGSLATEQTIGVEAQSLVPSSQAFLCNHVIRNLRSNGVQLAFRINTIGNTNGGVWVVFNPDSLPGNVWTRSNTTARWGVIEPHPSTTDWQYVDDDRYNDGVIRRTSAGTFVESGGGYPVIGNEFGPPMTARIYGFAYVAATNTVYCSNRSNLILKLSSNNAIVGTAIDTGGADIWNIRRNPFSGLIYAMDFRGNTVYVLNPADDSFVAKTGFNAPWDAVFTPTKSFAIQHGSPGLKEIV